MGHKPTGDERLHIKVQTPAQAFEAAGGGTQEPTGEQAPKRAPGVPLNTHGNESRLTVPVVTLSGAYAAAEDRRRAEGEKSGGMGGPSGS